MTWEEVIIVLFRFFGSFPVLRWPFLGGLFVTATDQGDLLLMNILDLGGVRDYQTLDKYIDQVYMLFFLLVALRWEAAPRNIAAGLYAFRLLGLGAFVIAGGQREVLLFFPNVFEFWFIFVAGLNFFNIVIQFTRAQVAVALVAVTGLKLGQEYALHHAKVFDGITMLEAIEAVFEFVTSPVRWLF
jgi:hypothetical protein